MSNNNIRLLLVLLLLRRSCVGIGSGPRKSGKAACREPLGVENGAIKDDQITVFSAYNDDFNTYGAQRARLNLKTWPQGHRANPAKASSTWLKIELKEDMIITGFATQGYGDSKVGEWVKEYMLLYSTGKDYLYFKDQSGDLKMFAGNTNWDSIKRNEVPIPTVVKSIMLMPTDHHNNFALRMELYGCKPDYYFVVSLMVLDTYFTTNYLNPNDTTYDTMKEDTEMEVSMALQGVPGFLGAKLERFSPEKSQYSELNLMAEIRIDCIEASVHFLTTKLQSSIQQTEGLFQSSSMKVQYPLDFSCRPPVVRVNLSKTESEATIIYLTESITLKGEVELRCNTTSQTLYTWELASVRMENKQLISPLTFGIGLIQVTEKARNWGVGLKYVRFTTSMTGQEGTASYDYGFINVTLPPLVANIKGPNEVVKGTGPFVLDARDSLDPSDPFTKYKGITFIWLCRRSGERFTNVNMSAPIDVISEKKRNKGGCFGYGPGRMKETGPLLHVEPAFMVSKNVYVFQVIITKDDRETKLEHQMKVNSSLSLYLRCLVNCGGKVSTNLRTTVETVCKGLTCKAIQSHNWILYTNIASHNDTIPKWQQVDDLDERTLTDLDSPSIVIKGKINDDENGLVNNAEYKLVGEIYLKDGSVEREHITFITNSPPEGGYCMADPNEGIAVTTQFFVQCDGFEDEDLPMQFEFRYHTNTGMVVIEKTLNNYITTMLPLGDPVSAYFVPIEVLVSDSFGASSMDFTYVIVKPMEAKDVSGTLKSMTTGADSPMGNLLKSGDVSKATQMAYAVLSLVDKSEGNIQATDRKSLKDGIIDQISKVKVKNLEQVTQVAAVVALATGQKEEISQKSQENAVNLLEDTAMFMANQKSDDPELLQNVGASLLHGIGNIMSAASSEAKETENEGEKRRNRQRPDKEREIKKKKGKEMSEKTLKLMEVVGGSLLSTKTVGEKPSVFKTKNMALLLDRQMASKMGNKKLGEGDSEVALPSAGTLFGNNSDSLAAIDSQMMAFDENPFTWDSSSQNIKSSVLEFKLKTGDGKVLDIKGLSKPIELFIPQKLETPKNVNGTSNGYFVKPSKDNKNIRSHQITIPSNDAAVFLTIKPQEGVSLVVYVRHLSKPTPDSYVFKKIMPDYTSCGDFDVQKGYHNCSGDPYTLTISSAITGEIGIHYVGVQYNPVQSMPTMNTQDEEVIRARVRRDCYSHNGRMKRGCVGVKDPPTTPAPTPFIIVPLYNASTDVNYTISISVSSCLYWSEKKSKWTSEGCKVGPKSVTGKLHCLCTHLSAFGGDFFVAPNPIDFDKVFAEFGRLGETGNFVVLATVCGLFGLFFIGLVFARKADKRDETKVVANVYLGEEDIQEGHIYQISVQTGMWRGYGTTANVGITIYGEEGKSDDILLTDKSLNKNFFSRGSVNNFTIVLPVSVGALLKIKLWHDNSGPSPAWFFHQVLIIDVQTGDQWHFLGNRWLAVEKGDGQIEVEILKADKKQLSGFKNLFYSRTARSLGEGHLWLSIFTRPPHNTFTRCQRLSCCLSILFAAMVTNAMFYQFGAEPKDTFNVGPLKMSWTQIKIGIQSSIVAIPVNILIVTIFRNIKQNVPDDDSQREDENSSNKMKKKKTPGCLPHFFIYVGWTLCILTSLTAAAFTVFYSLMWGANTSNQWLTSIMVSFFQDVIITQPIKVIAIASLLSLVLKKPPENDVVLGESLKNEKDEGKLKGCVAPRGEELEKQREHQKKVIEMFRTLVEIIFFMIFMILVTVVCYGNRSVSRYHMTEGMEKLCIGFEKALTTEKFWYWTKKKLLPALYDTDWYNGEPFSAEEGFVSNREVFIVGMPRLRQLRMRPGIPCSIENNEPKLSHQFKRCIPKYSHEDEDKTEFNMPEWKPVYNTNNSMSLFELLNLCPKPWRYRTARSLNSLPFRGAEVSYDGGGFVADLGYNTWQAMDVINDLESHKWIDDKTAAVIVEVTVFDPATSLFCHVKYLYEKFTTGGTNVRTTVKTLVLYSSSDQGFQSFYQVCQLMLMLMILFFFFVEIGKVYRQGRVYLRKFWNWMELVQIISAVAAIVMFFFKEKYTSDFVQKVQNNPYETSSIDYIVLWSDLEIYLLSLVIFVVTIKFLRLIRFNRSICQMTGTLIRSAKNIGSFFLIFVAILLGFTQLGFLAFGATVTAYSSFFQSLRSVMQMLLGGNMHFYELQSTNGIIGPIFTFVFMLSMTMILLNMFLAILNESYEETKEEEDSEDFADADLCDFMVCYFKNKYTIFREEYTNVKNKFVSIAENFISRHRNKRKEEDYSRLHFEDIRETNLCEDDSGEKKGSRFYLASIESFRDLLSDESLDDIKSSMTDLKQSLTSLHSLEGNNLLSLPKEYESLAYSSPKWDSPKIEINPVTSSQQTSIFDPPPSYARSIFDRPFEPATSISDVPHYHYLSGRYSPYSSSRAINNQGIRRSKYILTDEDEDESSANENSRLLMPESPTVGTTTTSVAKSDENE